MHLEAPAANAHLDVSGQPLRESDRVECRSVISSPHGTELHKYRVGNTAAKDVPVIELNQIDLKRAIHAVTNNSDARGWEQQLDLLSRIKQDAEERLARKKSEIIGKHMVSCAVSELREQEEEKLLKRLASPSIIKPLQAVTASYNSISMEDDQLLLSTDTAAYPFSLLSTGAMEQVLLCLRMGIASDLAGDDPMFILLDDAFQYSDWERREQLADQVMAYALNGWQVFYFTMDDHLRDLFIRKGKKLGEAFTEITLPHTAK